MNLREIYEVYGITRRMVQRYERYGLVSPSGRNKYGHLEYDEESVRKICTIRLFQRAGFRLSEMEELLLLPRDLLAEKLRRQMQFLELEHNSIIKDLNSYIRCELPPV